MNITEELERFNVLKRRIAKERNVRLKELEDLTYFKYTESTYNGYVYASTIEEWLRWVIPIHTK